MRNSRGYADGSSFRLAAAAFLQVVAAGVAPFTRAGSIDASCRWSAATGNRHTTTKTVQGRRAKLHRRPANPLVVRLPELRFVTLSGVWRTASVGDQVLPLTALRTPGRVHAPFGPICLRTGTMRVCSPDAGTEGVRLANCRPRRDQ
jgi:hypothetical protein